nr:hypothetical protein Aca09nite_28770 [Actinoplanes campanulatus]
MAIHVEDLPRGVDPREPTKMVQDVQGDFPLGGISWSGSVLRTRSKIRYGCGARTVGMEKWF